MRQDELGALLERYTPALLQPGLQFRFFQRLAHGLVRDGVGDALLDERVPQAGAGSSACGPGRGAADQGDQVGLASPWRTRGFRSLLLLVRSRAGSRPRSAKRWRTRLTVRASTLSCVAMCGVLGGPACRGPRRPGAGCGRACFLQFGAVAGSAPDGQFLALLLVETDIIPFSQASEAPERAVPSILPCQTTSPSSTELWHCNGREKRISRRAQCFPTLPGRREEADYGQCL